MAKIFIDEDKEIPAPLRETEPDEHPKTADLVFKEEIFLEETPDEDEE